MKYYFINDLESADAIYSEVYPYCMSEDEVNSLSREWETDLFEHMHEADADEMKRWGVYDEQKNEIVYPGAVMVADYWDGHPISYEAAVALMDDELREQIHADLAPCTEQEFYNEYCERHFFKFGENFTV